MENNPPTDSKKYFLILYLMGPYEGGTIVPLRAVVQHLKQEGDSLDCHLLTTASHLK